MEMDVIQEAPGLSRRQRQGTGESGRWSKAGRSLKDVRHGLPTGVDVPEVDSVEAALAKEASFEQEVGRVLLQWGQSSEGLQEMLLQVRLNRRSCCIIATFKPCRSYPRCTPGAPASQISRHHGEAACQRKSLL